MSAQAPLAVVAGKPVDRIPSSLFIPPEALRVFLDVFEGPLDLLHYLICRDNMDILDIPMAELTDQYLQYVERIIATNLELAADYLLMSATLIEIKSRMLLPQKPSRDAEEDDPRRDLVRRLLAYARIKAAAEALQARPWAERDFVLAGVPPPPKTRTVKPRVLQRDLVLVMLALAERKLSAQALQLQKMDEFTVREAMAHLMSRLQPKGWNSFTRLLGRKHASRSRVAAFFIALLQLANDELVFLRQRSEEDLAVAKRHAD